MDNMNFHEAIAKLGDLHRTSREVERVKAELLMRIFPINCLVESPAGLGRVVSYLAMSGPSFGMMSVQIINDFARMYRYDQLKPVNK